MAVLPRTIQEVGKPRGCPAHHADGRGPPQTSDDLHKLREHIVEHARMPKIASRMALPAAGCGAAAAASAAVAGSACVGRQPHGGTGADEGSTHARHHPRRMRSRHEGSRRRPLLRQVAAAAPPPMGGGRGLPPFPRSHAISCQSKGATRGGGEAPTGTPTPTILIKLYVS